MVTDAAQRIIKVKVDEIKNETKAKVGEIKEDLKTKVGTLRPVRYKNASASNFDKAKEKNAMNKENEQTHEFNTAETGAECFSGCGECLRF